MKYILFFTLFLLASCTSVTGVVTHPGGVPAKGAKVSLDAAGKAVTAKSSGRFKITTWRTREKASVLRAWLPNKQDSAGVKIVILRGKGKTPVNIVLPQ